MYYIYHIPGIKIGCTSNLKKRMSDQGFTSWEILEEHTDIYEVSDREIQLQKDYGLPVDTIHYWKAVQNRRKFTEEDRRKGGSARKLTFEEAQEIRRKHVPYKYTRSQLSKEYNVPESCIRKILDGETYFTP